jgi:uncharacterized OB-fold protein
MEYKLTYRKYAEALKNGRLLGLKCRHCQAFTVPPKIVCIECNSHEMDIVELRGVGTIRTFTVIRVAPEGFKAPYIVGEVELEEGPWLMGNIVQIDPDRATLDLIGRKARVGYQVFPGDKFSCGEVVVPAFEVIAGK